MNTTLPTRTEATERRLQHPPQRLEQYHAHPQPRHVGPLDRAALHLGMALIRWGRRPDPERARLERRATRIERALHDRESDLRIQELRVKMQHNVGPRHVG